ncbi:MAG: PilZ domain-containing protein [Candidatus Omnitrophica bacterium]|nr:PilZ domain-containing protein [Candidatus Omnitrophota bacterium]
MVTIEAERRAYTRAKRILSIEYRLHKNTPRSTENKWCLSTTYDMSVNGLAFFSENEYHKNDILDVNVTMSGVLEIYKGLAQVKRVAKKRTGACFLVGLELINKSQTKKRNVTKKIKPIKKRRI